jgi:cation transport ATPase
MVISFNFNLNQAVVQLNNCSRLLSKNKRQTPVLVGSNRKLLGIIGISDGLRLEANEALHLLQEAGLKHLAMLTGLPLVH